MFRRSPHSSRISGARCGRPADPDRRIARAARRRGQRAVILVTHEEGGGVERMIGQAAKAHRGTGHRAIVLRPGRMADGRLAVLVDDGCTGSYPNLRYALPEELSPLLRLLLPRHLLPLFVQSVRRVRS